MTKIGIIVLLLLNAIGGCGSESFVSTVDDSRSSEGYIVIRGGRDRGVKVGDLFILSRGPHVTAQVVVFEVGDITCKARASRKRAILSDVRTGDVALRNGSEMESKVGALLLFSVSTGFWAGLLVLSWLGFTRISNYVTVHNLWGSGFLPVSFKCLRVWFLFLSLGGSFLIVGTTYLAAFVEHMYIQDLVLAVYPLMGILILGTLGAAGLLTFFARHTP